MKRNDVCVPNVLQEMRVVISEKDTTLKSWAIDIDGERYLINVEYDSGKNFKPVSVTLNRGRDVIILSENNSTIDRFIDYERALYNK